MYYLKQPLHCQMCVLLWWYMKDMQMEQESQSSPFPHTTLLPTFSLSSGQRKERENTFTRQES